MSAAAVVVTVVLLGATATRATLQLGMNLDGVSARSEFPVLHALCWSSVRL
eukprot:m.408395 g.408395  ORF g.408395 m.408395 type:complete len:51 (-) comp20146_c0_seq4:1878-2030(-)